MSLVNLDENLMNVSYQPSVEELQNELAQQAFSLDYSRMLAGKVCLVTGASYGIGYEISRLFAQHGARLIVVSRNSEKLESAAAKIREEVPDADIRVYAADTVDAQKTYALFELIEAEYGRLDVLVNNAATGGHWRVDTFPDDVLDRTVELNLKAPMRYAREALKLMLPRHYGRIINVSSANGVRPLCGAVYTSTKGGLNNFTVNTAIRCVGTGVTSNAICPGFTLTPLAFGTVTDGQGAPPDQANTSILMSKTVRNTPVFPIDQANLALFLASDMARGITGQIIVCDNGQYL